MTAFPVTDHPSQIAGQVGGGALPAGPRPRRVRRAAPAGAAAALVLRLGPARRRLVGPPRARCASAWCSASGAEWLELWETDALAGGSKLWDAHRPFASRCCGGRCGVLELSGPCVTRVGGVRQRQLRPDAGAAVAGAGLGGRVPGRGLRHGGDADVAGRLRQPAGPVAAQRRAAGGVAAVRPRPRRLRDGRGRGDVRAGAGGVGPPALGAASTPRWPASAPAATPTTWSSPAPTRSRRSPPCGRRWPTPASTRTRSITSTPTPPARRSATWPRRGVLKAVFGDAAEARAGQLDQEHDRPPADGGGRRRGAGLRGGDGPRGAAADDQSGRSRPGMRPLPRRQRGAAGSRCAMAVSNSFGFGGSNTCLVLKAA